MSRGSHDGWIWTLGSGRTIRKSAPCACPGLGKSRQPHIYHSADLWCLGAVLGFTGVIVLECLVSSVPKIQRSELPSQALRRICPGQEGSEAQEFQERVRDVPSQGLAGLRVWPRLKIGFKSDGFGSSLVLFWGQQGGGVRGGSAWQGRDWGV